MRCPNKTPSRRQTSRGARSDDGPSYYHGYGPWLPPPGAATITRHAHLAMSRRVTRDTRLGGWHARHAARHMLLIMSDQDCHGGILPLISRPDSHPWHWELLQVTLWRSEIWFFYALITPNIVHLETYVVIKLTPLNTTLFSHTKTCKLPAHIFILLPEAHPGVTKTTPNLQRQKEPWIPNAKRRRRWDNVNRLLLMGCGGV